jgi:hypothetical protein
MSSFSLPDADRIRRALEAERDRDKQLDAAAPDTESPVEAPESSDPTTRSDEPNNPNGPPEEVATSPEASAGGEDHPSDAAGPVDHNLPPGTAANHGLPAPPPPTQPPTPTTPTPATPPPGANSHLLDADAPFSHVPDQAPTPAPTSRWRPVLILLVILTLAAAAVAGWSLARNDDEPVSAGTATSSAPDNSSTPGTEASPVTAAATTAGVATTSASAPSTSTPPSSTSEPAPTTEPVATTGAAPTTAAPSTAAPATSPESTDTSPTPFAASVITELVRPVEVRDAPSATAEVLGELRAGAGVTVLARQKGWYRIEYRNTEAWVFAAYVVPPAPGFEAYIAVDGSQLRPVRENGSIMGGYLGGKYAFGRPPAADGTVTIFLPNGAVATLPASQVRPVT